MIRAKNRFSGLPRASVCATVTRTALLGRLAGAGVVKVEVLRFHQPNSKSLSVIVAATLASLFSAVSRPASIASSSWGSLAAAAKATEALPLLPSLLHPDRWLLWLGVLFVLSVYFFPTGIVGKLRQGRG